MKEFISIMIIALLFVALLIYSLTIATNFGIQLTEIEMKKYNTQRCIEISKSECIYNEYVKDKIKCEHKIFKKCMKWIQGE